MTDNQGNTLRTVEKKLIIETRAFVLYSLEGGILLFDYHDNIVIELSDVKEAFELYVEHSHRYSYRVLISFGKFATMEVDARRYTENKTMPTPALAVVLHNLAQRMIGRFYQLLRKDKHPLKFFKSKEEAFLWLNSIDSDTKHEPDKELLN